MSIVFDPKDVDTTDRGDGQQKTYLALSDEERAKGFVRPVRTTYKHVGIAGPKHPLRDLTEDEHGRYDKYGYVKFEDYPGSMRPVGGRFWTQAELDRIGKGCQATTTMNRVLSETYACKPSFYGATFCATCNKHLPVGVDGEFVWVDDGERVGT